MTKLAGTLAASPDPNLLELRILANHGSDPRFAFLRKGGKWANHWADLRAPKPPPPLAAVERSEPVGGGLGLVAYESDADDESDGKAERPVEVLSPTNDTGKCVVDEAVANEFDEAERARKEAKAEKARAWAAKRKLAREAVEASTA